MREQVSHGAGRRSLVRRLMPYSLALAGLAVAFLAIGASPWSAGAYGKASRQQSLGLSAQVKDGLVVLSWDIRRPPVAIANRAILTIKDAGRREDIELASDVLRKGRIGYSLLSGDASFQLSVIGPQSEFSTESVRVLVPAR